ncbi:hypothetical protein [Streptomyces sp. AP-93]|nr:hypothetical protein [Streptomyces sp. AP-93]MCJ0873603.1 hypothetical protein [Streptomyces sp. AP-93]
MDSVKAQGNQELSAALSRREAYIGRRTVDYSAAGFACPLGWQAVVRP